MKKENLKFVPGDFKLKDNPHFSLPLTFNGKKYEGENGRIIPEVPKPEVKTEVPYSTPIYSVLGFTHGKGDVIVDKTKDSDEDLRNKVYVFRIDHEGRESIYNCKITEREAIDNLARNVEIQSMRDGFRAFDTNALVNKIHHYTKNMTHEEYVAYLADAHKKRAI